MLISSNLIHFHLMAVLDLDEIKKNSSKEEMRDVENCADGDICKRHPTNDNSPIHIWLYAGRRYRRGRGWLLFTVCVFIFFSFHGRVSV